MKKKEFGARRVHSKHQAGDTSKSAQIFAEEQQYISPGFKGLRMRACPGARTQRDRYRRRRQAVYRLCFRNWRGQRVIAIRVKALRRQLEELTFGSFTTAVRMRFLRLLASLLPPPLTRIQLFFGRSRSCRGRFQIGKIGDQEIRIRRILGRISWQDRRRSRPVWRRLQERLWPLHARGFYLSPFAYCYRCPLKLRYPSCGLACAEISSGHQIANRAADCRHRCGTNSRTAGNVVPLLEFYLPSNRSRRSLVPSSF